MEQTVDQQEMRTVYYIVAPSGSGKTTLGRRLATEMDLPLYHADLVYNALAKKYDIDCSPAKLTIHTLWDNPNNFGIPSWGKYPSMADAKREAYAELLKGVTGDFIIEGFTLSFAFERDLVSDAVGVHRAVIIRLILDLGTWADFILRKPEPSPPPSQANLDSLNSVFETADGDITLEFSHPSQVTAASVGAACFDIDKTTDM